MQHVRSESSFMKLLQYMVARALVCSCVYILGMIICILIKKRWGRLLCCQSFGLGRSKLFLHQLSSNCMGTFDNLMVR